MRALRIAVGLAGSNISTAVASSATTRRSKHEYTPLPTEPVSVQDQRDGHDRRGHEADGGEKMPARCVLRRGKSG